MASEIKNGEIKNGIVHFIGIGGIGMSGIAELMHNLGYQVQGSDVAVSGHVQRLEKLGIKTFTGHDESHIRGARTIVFSSAIPESNAELRAAREQHIPVLRRADMLAELMRFKKSIAVAGAHGKTTTTSLIAAILDKAGYDPTVINGGIINAYGANARKGESEWMVVEADESDGSFVHLPASIVVITNIDREHMDHYGNFDRLKQAFQFFVENIPFDGFAIVCQDDDEAAKLLQLGSRRMISYGLSPEASISANIMASTKAGALMSISRNDPAKGKAETFQARLALPGRHNVQNALAAAALAMELGISTDIIRQAFESFSGVARRFSLISEKNGIRIYDDYAHHPAEISAVLAAARELAQGQVIAIVQPHRYSRLRALFDRFAACFDDADIIAIAPVHAAGEADDDSFNSDQLIAALKARGHKKVIAISGAADIPDLIARHARAGDIVIGMGAGSIGSWMQNLAIKEAS